MRQTSSASPKPRLAGGCLQRRDRPVSHGSRFSLVYRCDANDRAEFYEFAQRCENGDTTNKVEFKEWAMLNGLLISRSFVAAGT